MRRRILKKIEGLQGPVVPGKVDFIDIHDAFLLPTGDWDMGLTVDGNHLKMRGYDVLMKQIRESPGEAMK